MLAERGQGQVQVTLKLSKRAEPSKGAPPLRASGWHGQLARAARQQPTMAEPDNVEYGFDLTAYFPGGARVGWLSLCAFLRFLYTS